MYDNDPYTGISDYLKQKAIADTYYLDRYASGQKRLGDDVSVDFKPMTPDAPTISQAPIKSSGELMAEVGTNAAAGGAAGGIGGAAIAAGGTLLTNYLAQKAADERQRRQNAASIEQTYGQNQTNAYNSILANLGRALR